MYLKNKTLPIGEKLMSERHIKFMGAGEDDNAGLICAEGPINDLTVCGYTLDGDDKTAGGYIVTSEKINCPQCIQIINYCKSIKKSEYNS